MKSFPAGQEPAKKQLLAILKSGRVSKQILTSGKLSDIDGSPGIRYYQSMKEAGSMVAAPTSEKVWTEAELQSLPENGYNHEVVDGELIMSPKNDAFHGDISAELLTALRTFVKAKKLGAVWDSSTGFWMKNRNCRAPDISFVSRTRLQELNFRLSSRQFFPGAPDLAVEIRAPSNSRRELDERLKDFFESGTRLAWIIDPEKQCVEICRSVTERRLIGSGGNLDGENLLPGFAFAIADLFKRQDWE